MTTDETHTTPKTKGKEPLYTSDDDTANEERRHPPSPTTATSDRDLKEVVESDPSTPVRGQTEEEDVGEQLRNLELNPPNTNGNFDDDELFEEWDGTRTTQERELRESHKRRQAKTSKLELIPEGDKMSKETHLENYIRLVEHGWSPKDARGRYRDKNYGALGVLKKPETNPYDHDPENKFVRKDGKGHLRDAWRHLKDNWEVLPPPSHESCLRTFWKKLSSPDPEPFNKAVGNWHTYRWTKLKEIVDQDLNFPELAEAERVLKDRWTYTPRTLKDIAVTKSAQDHLDDFFKDFKYDTHGDFEKARGVDGGARCTTLYKLAKKPDAECSEQELRFKGIWDKFTVRLNHPLRSVPYELRNALMDIIENPETPREEKLAELYNKMVREKEQSFTQTSFVNTEQEC
ncbi:MAG: hypothetical protein CMB57_04050 [Euryarchaeota archaeon]|mgnify:CR=1 FL=1|nr:hypothetical protein [Euryarchaeota archaeon]|tara:strand:- start:6663 stop:7871 length:1209 start_codon:yes stop_codon:yes gene_type:complete